MPSRLRSELNRLNMSFNPEAKEQLDRLGDLTSRCEDAGRDNSLETANFVRETTMKEQDEKVEPEYVEPKTFQEACNHPDPIQRKFWREGIRKEFRDMIARKV